MKSTALTVIYSLILACTACGTLDIHVTKASSKEEQQNRAQFSEVKKKTISVDFQNTDIRNAMKILEHVSGKKIVVDESIQQKVTMKMVDTPWEEILDTLVDTHGLNKKVTGETIRITQ